MTQAVLQRLVDSFFPGDFTEVVLKRAPHLAPYKDDPSYATYFQKPTVQISSEAGGRYLSVRHQALGLNISCYVKPVEACCGMAFLHTFNVSLNNMLSQEQFEQLMDCFLGYIATHITSTVEQRIMVNMIETSGKYKDPLADMSEHKVNEDMIMFKPLWDYLHKNSQKVNVQYMPNKNTGNVILHMEVLTKSGQFHKAN